MTDKTKEEEIKNWIETCLDGDAHGKWKRAPLFSVLEDVAELMAPRIVLKIDQALTAEREQFNTAVETVRTTIGDVALKQNRYGSVEHVLANTALDTVLNLIQSNK